MPQNRFRSGRPTKIVEAALFIALVAVAAQVVVAFGPVPFTLQAFVAVLAALVLTPAHAAATWGGYLLLGLLGLPVFSMFRGGLSVIAGPTGGYLYGFLVGAALGSWVRRKLCPPKERDAHPKRAFAADAAAGAVVLLASYAVGTLHFMALGYAPGGAQGLAYVLGACVLPFVVPDIAKVAVALTVARALRRALPAVAAR